MKSSAFIMKRKRIRPVLSVLLAALLAGCAADDPNRRAKTGAAVGAVVGAVVGHQLDRDSGRFVGAAVGALAGGMVGNYMDQQQREFEAQLEAERRQHQIEVQRLKDQSLKIDIASEVSFDFDSARLKSAFLPTLDKVAEILKRYDQTLVHVIGHTDSIGSEAYNQRLSERRAQSVVDYLVSRGVPRQRLHAEGRGEREPRASNATAAGRQLNRRVELIVKPVVEGREEEAYRAPAPAGR
ncbi:OmpA family protein [Thiohalobacter sp. IOR34]|uniref:OmpA family protein n=1 Tax=Thiohalobacter sp. IOR34 TaxID=3057176 RepID=UPI0025AF186E|nr:OmpA family protein [Thiohalobacter sp. IOR34]WJW74794.1 OmpA family protein [Thiohalobacter sp. IOR34]